jgi:hypothetical protein
MSKTPLVEHLLFQRSFPIWTLLKLRSKERGRERDHQPGSNLQPCEPSMPLPAAMWLPIPRRLLCLESARPHSTLLRRQRQRGWTEIDIVSLHRMSIALV